MSAQAQTSVVVEQQNANAEAARYVAYGARFKTLLLRSTRYLVGQK
jgi:hypothetical protein